MDENQDDLHVIQQQDINTKVCTPLYVNYNKNIDGSIATLVESRNLVNIHKLKHQDAPETLEIERVILNTVHSNLSGEMKQEVIKATLAQLKDINAMQTEMGSIYSMLKDIHIHFMPNSRPLPPRPNYEKLRSTAGQI
jgi:hypothetical protein